MATPYDRVNAAWESADRRAALHRVVETMAVEGVTLGELDTALDRLLMDVRASGADDDTEEIIMGVGDRLHDWCVPDRRIETRSSLLPTEAELDRLPRWARVAFEARCVRRALPLFSMSQSSVARENGALIAQVVQGIERAASEKRSAAAMENRGLFNAVMAAKRLGDERLYNQATVANAAHEALLIASGSGSRRTPGPATVFKARNDAPHELIVQAANEWSAEIQDGIRRDFDFLSRVALERGWTGETAVPPDVFGPLWPDGIPPAWPSENGFHAEDSIANRVT